MQLVVCLLILWTVCDDSFMLRVETASCAHWLTDCSQCVCESSFCVCKQIAFTCCKNVRGSTFQQRLKKIIRILAKEHKTIKQHHAYSPWYWEATIQSNYMDKYSTLPPPPLPTCSINHFNHTFPLPFILLQIKILVSSVPCNQVTVNGQCTSF